MARISTYDLSGADLDRVVAKLEGVGFFPTTDPDRRSNGYIHSFNPSLDPAQGQPIIERERIGLIPSETALWWFATLNGCKVQGRTALIAAMRCYVASKMGMYIDFPEDLS